MGRNMSDEELHKQLQYKRAIIVEEEKELRFDVRYGSDPLQHASASNIGFDKCKY